MRNTIKKWSVLVCGIIAAVSFALCGVSSLVLREPVSVSAETTTYTVTGLVGDGGDGRNFYAKATANVEQFNPGADDWTTQFALVAGTGVGFALNGVPFTPAGIKQPGEWTTFYIELGKTAENGDVLTINGTYQSIPVANGRDVAFVFNSCALKYNGSAWETWNGTYVEPALTSGTDTTLTFAKFAAIKTVNAGQGVMVNGKAASFSASSNSLTLSQAVHVGDVLQIGGIFDSKYAITDSAYRWDGSAWNALVGYSEIISRISTSGDSASSFYITLTKHIGVDNWDALTSAGGKIALNGTLLENAKLQLVGTTLYANLGESAANGDVLSFGGEYVYGGIKVVFAPTQVLQFNGSKWELLEGIVCDLGELSMSAEGSDSSSLYVTTGSSLPVQSGEFIFETESGDGVLVNGIPVAFSLKSLSSNLLIQVTDGVNVGDVLSIGGVFYCEERQVRYVIAPSYFKWDGSAWTAGAPYYVQTVAQMQIASTDGSNFFMQLGGTLVFDDWGEFSLVSGDGILLNNQTANVKFKAVGDKVYVDLGTNAQAGDILMIDGTYKYTKDGVTAELKFTAVQIVKYDGSAWVVASEAIAELGALAVNTPSMNGTGSTRPDHLYTKRADNGTLPIQSWDVAFVAENSTYVTLNGNPVGAEIKSTDAGLWFGFSVEAKPGEIVTIGGTFVCQAENIRYVIEETKFRWTGSVWETYTLTSYQIGKVVATKDSNASAVYFCAESGIGFVKTDGTWTEKLTFFAGSGVGITLNGAQINMGDIKIPNDIYIGLGSTAQVGDVLVIGGAFENKNLQARYVIEESRFVWNGTVWIASYDDSALFAYDTVSLTDVGAGLTIALDGNAYDGSGLRYVPSGENTTGSVKFRFVYTSANGAGCISIRLRGGAWDGVHFRIYNTLVGFVDKESAVLNVGAEYLIEFAAINTKEGTVWAYYAIDGVIMETKTLTDFAFEQNSVSIYADAGTNATLTDSDNIAVSYENSERVDYVKKNSQYTIADLATDGSFIAWAIDGDLYQTGDVVVLGEESVQVLAVRVEFVLKYGASIRLAATAEESGIRFTGMMNTADVMALANYGITVKEYGTLIMPNDYLSENQAPNLTDFIVGKTILQIPNKNYREEIGEYTVYYGAMTTIKEKNYARDFAGRGYMILELPNGESKTMYTPFSADNVRSVRYVAQAFREDKTEPNEGEIRYHTISVERQAIVDEYASSPDYSTTKTMLASMEEGYQAAYVVHATGRKYGQTGTQDKE